ncbi:MAG: cardiolipin synthase B [Gammaproteobacteria bacterium]|nr:cardiolipin synthase B [Gammaproteobacteria bacterium]
MLKSPTKDTNSQLDEPSEFIISDCIDFFESLYDDIGKATRNIDLETYIFSNDTVGEKIARGLVEAAQRGVRVRVLVDGAGTPLWGNTLTKTLENAGIETRVFHPFPWRLWQWSRSVVRVSPLVKAIYLLLKINSRNHRKVCIIDDNVAYVGSLNISETHLDTKHWGDCWRDTAVKLQGVDLKELKTAFECAWDHMPIQERIREIFSHINKNPVFRVNNTRHRRRILYKNLLRRISRATEKIWITNAYFIPDNILLKKLVDAAERGVDVRILLPERSDVFILPWTSATFYYHLVKAGVRIFEYLPSMLHAKTLIIDDWVSVGSSNLNHRSLLHDLEVDVNLRLPNSKKMIQDQFILDLEQSKEVDLNSWQRRPFYQRIIGRLLLYVKYLI